MTSPSYTVFIVSTPASPDHISSYKNIRLKGLLLDPEAFGSTYAKESAFPPETWQSRLNWPGRTTLGAAKTGDEIGGEWIGTLSLLAPEMMRPEHRDEYPPRLKEAEDSGEAEVYMLVGMWVDSSYRQMGVGSALIIRALEIAKSAVSHPVEVRNRTEQPKNKKIFVLLEVHESNTAARKLYEKMGFRVEEGHGASGDQHEMWMAIDLY